MKHSSRCGVARARAASLLRGSRCMLGGCEHPPVETVQSGIRGLGNEQVINPRLDAISAGKEPDTRADPARGCRRAAGHGRVPELQVLKDLNVGSSRA